MTAPGGGTRYANCLHVEGNQSAVFLPLAMADGDHFALLRFMVVSVSSIRFTTMRSYRGRIFILVKLQTSFWKNDSSVRRKGKAFHRVAAHGTVPLLDISPISVRFQPQKNTQGTLV